MSAPERPPFIAEARWRQLWGQRPEDVEPEEWASRMSRYAASLQAAGYPATLADNEEVADVRLSVDVGLADPFQRELVAAFLLETCTRADAPRHPAVAFLAELAAAIRQGNGPVVVKATLARADRELVHKLVTVGWQRARAEHLPAADGMTRIMRALDAAGWAPPPDPTTAKQLDRAFGHSGPM